MLQEYINEIIEKKVNNLLTKNAVLKKEMVDLKS